jgi:phosphatidylglycerol:prolipoprotein diacylglycerol transferase
MYPILVSIGPLRLYSYGLMLAIAFLTAAHFAVRRSYLFNIPKEIINNLTLLIIIAGVIGARIVYVIMNLNYFRAHRLEIFMINRGGLVFYGGFILAFIASVIFVRINKISLLDTADLLAPFIALGHSIGRIGCFLNGCCYGKQTHCIIGVKFPGTEVKVWPTQLISSCGLFIIFLVLFCLQQKRKFKGEIIFSYLTIYGIFRFLEDFLRGDLTSIFYFLTTTQTISIGFIIVGLLGLIFFSKWQKRI